MKLQTYTIGETGLEWIKPGTTVYGWPYPDWGLCEPDEVAIFLTPSDVAVIYAIDLSQLTRGPVVDLPVNVREGITSSYSMRMNAVGPMPAEMKLAQVLELVKPHMPDEFRYKQIESILRSAAWDFRSTIGTLILQLDLARRHLS